MHENEVCYRHRRSNRRGFRGENISVVAFIVGFIVLFSLLKYLLIALVIIVFYELATFFLYKYLQKQLTAEQPILLSAADAQEGVEAKITVVYLSQRIAFDFFIPPNTKNGRKFVAKNIMFKNQKGRCERKNVHFKVLIKDN